MLQEEGSNAFSHPESAMGTVTCRKPLLLASLVLQKKKNLCSALMGWSLDHMLLGQLASLNACRLSDKFAKLNKDMCHLKLFYGQD